MRGISELLRLVFLLSPRVIGSLSRVGGGRSAVDLAIGTPRPQRSRSDVSKNLQHSTSSSFFLLTLVLLVSESKTSLIAH